MYGTNRDIFAIIYLLSSIYIERFCLFLAVFIYCLYNSYSNTSSSDSQYILNLFLGMYGTNRDIFAIIYLLSSIYIERFCLFLAVFIYCLYNSYSNTSSSDSQYILNLFLGMYGTNRDIFAIIYLLSSIYIERFCLFLAVFIYCLYNSYSNTSSSDSQYILNLFLGMCGTNRDILAIIYLLSSIYIERFCLFLTVFIYCLYNSYPNTSSSDY